jgi:hypothetical protein
LAVLHIRYNVIIHIVLCKCKKITIDKVTNYRVRGNSYDV